MLSGSIGEWILRFCSAPAEAREPGEPYERLTRPFCCLQAPVGAQVASPQSPILRWSKRRSKRHVFIVEAAGRRWTQTLGATGPLHGQNQDQEGLIQIGVVELRGLTQGVR